MVENEEPTRQAGAKDSDEVLSLQEMESEEDDVQPHASTMSVTECTTLM